MSQGMYGSSTQQSFGREASDMSAMRHGSGEQQSLTDHLMQFCKENPATAAAWCFGIGFVLGWRLKPW